MKCITAYIRKISSKILKDVHKAQNTDKITVFLGGECDDKNPWRDSLKKEYGDKIFFIDPYDKDWDPADNIYDELAGMIVSDHVIFYKGGKGSENEQKFLDLTQDITKAKYSKFKDLERLESFIKTL